MLEVASSFKLAAVAVLGAAAAYFCLRKKPLPSPSKLALRLVAISGCDSGLGYSMAVHCHQIGFYVLAMVLDPSSSGAKSLKGFGNMFGRLQVIQVDITKPDQILAAVKASRDLLDDNKVTVFHGLINNAGVMVFGETEWQTEHTTAMQIEVNLAGAIRLTRHFAPLLRNHQGRLVNVSSHCASLPLPGLAVYAASKAGLQAWSDALRVEWAKYGIAVITLIPGAFFQQTNILSRQMVYAEEMRAAMSEEALSFYGDYFTEYHSYLSGLAGEKRAAFVQSDKLYHLLDSALLDPRPRLLYHDTPLRYRMYHRLAHAAPTSLRDWLVTRFIAMPSFKPTKNQEASKLV